MKNFQKGISKREFVLGAIFVFLGFYCAFYFFKFLVRPKRVATPTLPSVIEQSFIETQLVKEGQKESDVAEVDIVPKDDVQEQLVQEEDVVDTEIPQLILNGIFASETGSFALINNRIVKEGDSILGVKVLRIYSHRVELDAFGKEITLRVK
ncbi:MAG: hypothetical protein ISS47_02185 [Candidatus Omnitrophica bacterium]|nr:hypothetical protein [Candidatus Omnitrophota bacterium]